MWTLGQIMALACRVSPRAQGPSEDSFKLDSPSLLAGVRLHSYNFALIGFSCSSCAVSTSSTATQTTTAMSSGLPPSQPS